MGLLLAVPRQQVAPGREAQGASHGPCGDDGALERERVVEGATAERQVRGAVDPAHPVERGTAPNPSHTAWCECVALVTHLVKLQEACDAKANHRGRGVKNAMDVAEKKNGPRKHRQYRSHLAWMTAVRDQVAVVETGNMDDLVLSQGGTTIANLVRYQHKVGNLGRQYSSPLGAQRCSNLVWAYVPPPATEDFDTVNAMTNLVVQAVRKMDLSSWLPLRELSSWFDYADHHGDSWTVAGLPGREDEGGHLRRRPRVCRPRR